MEEHTVLYRLLLEDKEKNPMSEEGKKKILNAIREFFQNKKKPP